MDARDRLVVTLDRSDREGARDLVRRLGDAAPGWRIGLPALTAGGTDLARDLLDAGKRVWLDLKLHEAPNAAAATVHAAAELGASAVTVQAIGGRAMLEAAVRAARAEPGLALVAVTVLPGQSTEDLREFGIRSSLATHALRLARLAQGCGCRGVACAPAEVAMLRGTLAPGTAIVTSAAEPAAALRAGASQVFVGRAVTRDADPRGALLRQIEAVHSALN